MSITKDRLMDAMSAKIARARDDLVIGWHNPELMEEISNLNDIIKLVTTFERRLLSDLDDID